MYWYLLILGILFILMVYINQETKEGFASRETFGHLSLVEMIAQLRSQPSAAAAPNAFGSNVKHKKQSYYIDSCNYDPTSILLDDINFCRSYATQNPVNPFADARFNSTCGICMTQGTILLNQAPFSISATTNGTGVVVYKEDKDYSIHEGTQAVPSSHSAFCEPLLINSNLIPATAHINNITGLVINSDQYTDTLAYLNNMKYITFNDVTSCAASISKSIQCTFSNTVIASMRFVSGHFNDETCEAGSNLVDLETNPTPSNCIGQQSCTFSSNLPAGYRQWYLTAECAVQEEDIPPGLPPMYLTTPTLPSTYPSYWTVPYRESPKQQITVYGACILSSDTEVKIESYTNANFDLYLHTLKQYSQPNTGSTPKFNAPATVFALYKGRNTIRLDISSPNTDNGIYFVMKDLSGRVVCSLDTTWVYSQYRSHQAFAPPPIPSPSPSPSPIPSPPSSLPWPSTTPFSLSSRITNGTALTVTPVTGPDNVGWSSFSCSPDGTTIYAVAYYYMYKSTDRGATWALQSVSNTTGITDRRYYRICMSSDSSYGLLSTYGGPLFVYRNGRWNLATGIPTFGAVTCTPNASVMYVACESAGVYKSTDYGVTWTRLLEGVDTASGVNRAWRTITCSSDGVYVLVASYNYGAYVSWDSGATWRKTTLNPSLAWQSSTCSADGTKMSVLHNGGELYISQTSGASWVKAVTCPQTGGDLSVCSSADGMKYIVTAANGLLVSTDGGNSWIYQSATFPVNGSIALSADGSLGIIGPPSTGTLYILTVASLPSPTPSPTPSTSRPGVRVIQTATEQAPARAAPAPPQPVPVYNYSVQDFVQYTARGTDLPGQPMTGTVAECQTACSSQPTCLGFSRSKFSSPTDSGNCWLKQNIDNKTPEQMYNTYVRGSPVAVSITRSVSEQAETRSAPAPPQPAPVHTYSVQDFVQYTEAGTDLTGQPMTGTVAECQTACSAQPTCLGFSRSKYSDANTNGACWLKQNMNNKTPRQMYNTYVKN